MGKTALKIGNSFLSFATLHERLKHGKTLDEIAQSYNISTDELYEALSQYDIGTENRKRIEVAYKQHSKNKRTSSKKGESSPQNVPTLKKKEDDQTTDAVVIEKKDVKKPEENKMESIATITRAQELKKLISIRSRDIEEIETKLNEANKEIAEIAEECGKKNEELANICKMLEQAKFDLEKCKFRATAADERKKSFEKDLSESKASLESMQKELMLLEALIIEVVDGKVKVSNEAYLPKPEMISETSTKFFLSGEYEMLTGQQIKLLATVCIILDSTIMDEKQYRINYDTLPIEIVDCVKSYENSVNDIAEW